MKFFNFFSSAVPAQPTLTVAIFDDRLIITNPADAAHPTTLTLEPRTVYHGILFKPSMLVIQLTSYLASIKLKRPVIDVHLPPSIEHSSPFLPFFVLQYTLALSKINVRLARVTCATGQQTTDNLLALLHRPGSKSPKFWLTLTLAATCALSTGIMIKHRVLTAQATSLTGQETVLKNTNTDYENQFKETNKLKSDINQLQEKDAKEQEVLHKFHKPTKVLSTLAHQTPANLWLVSVRLDKAANKQHRTTKNKAVKPTKSAKKEFLVTIKGTSSSSSAISKLLNRLGRRTSSVSHPTLVAIAKEQPLKKKGHKKSHKNTFYHFIIEGTVRQS